MASIRIVDEGVKPGYDDRWMRRRGILDEGDNPIFDDHDDSLLRSYGLIPLAEASQLLPVFMTIVQPIGNVTIGGVLQSRRIAFTGWADHQTLMRLLRFQDFSAAANPDEAKLWALGRDTGVLGGRYGEARVGNIVVGKKATELWTFVFDVDPGLLWLLAALPDAQLVVWKTLSHEEGADWSDPRAAEYSGVGFRALVICNRAQTPRSAEQVHNLMRTHYGIDGQVSRVGLLPCFWEDSVRATGVWVRLGPGFDPVAWKSSFSDQELTEALGPQRTIKVRRPVGSHAERDQPLCRLVRQPGALAALAGLIGMSGEQDGLAVRGRLPGGACMLTLGYTSGLPVLVSPGGYGNRGYAEHYINLIRKGRRGDVLDLLWLYRALVDSGVHHNRHDFGTLRQFKARLSLAGCIQAMNSWGHRVWYHEGLGTLRVEVVDKLWSGIALLDGWHRLHGDSWRMVIGPVQMAGFFGMAPDTLAKGLKWLCALRLLRRRPHTSQYELVHSAVTTAA